MAFLKTIATIIWSWTLAALIVFYVAPLMRFEASTLGRVFEEKIEADLLPLVWSAAVGALVLRTVASWLIDVQLSAGSAEVKSEIRSAAFKKINDLGVEWIKKKSSGDLTFKLTTGLDALDDYFSKFMPQLIFTVITTPVIILVLLVTDLASGLLVLAVLPVIPLFMVLVGLATQGAQDLQWQGLQKLSYSYLDILRGVKTLKIYKAEDKQATKIRAITRDYRLRTMKVLRLTFISGFVLDLAASLSVAIVAVTVGTRLVSGSFPLTPAIFLLILTPEVFLAIRQVGAAYHASSAGMSSANQVFEILEENSSLLKKPSSAFSPILVRAENFQGLRAGQFLHEPVSFELRKGEFLAISGRSGAGKSTLLDALMGLANFCGDLQVAERFAYVGQRPALLQGTVLQNITLGDKPSEIDLQLAKNCLQRTGLDAALLETEVGFKSSGVSGGQASRIAIARALYFARKNKISFFILDEPTSQLDEFNETLVIDILREETNSGASVLTVTHSKRVKQRADRVLELSNG